VDHRFVLMELVAISAARALNAARMIGGHRAKESYDADYR
jgi:hypothetical protein